MNSKTLTLAGAVVLIIGLFLPVASVFGISGSMMMAPGESVSAPGLVLAACAVLGAVLALVNQAKWAVIPAIAAVGFLVWKYMQLQNALSGSASGMPAETAEALSQVASINYLGWGVMGLGAVVMLVGGAMGWKSSGSAPAA